MLAVGTEVSVSKIEVEFAALASETQQTWLSLVRIRADERRPPLLSILLLRCVSSQENSTVTVRLS